MRNTLHRREHESIADHVQRLCVDPLVQGATDAELARLAGITPKKLRELRGNDAARAFAELVRAHLVRPEGETLSDFLHAAITDYAWRHCEAGRCTHTFCERDRAARQTHDTRHPFTDARPVDQSRGAPGTRNPGGASARSIVP